MKDNRTLTTRLALLALIASPLAACSGDDYLPAPTGSDGGPIGRPISDADFRDRRPADSDDDGGGGGDDDGPGGDAGVEAARVTITVQSPTSGAIAPAQTKFTPAVEVRVEAAASRAEET